MFMIWNVFNELSSWSCQSKPRKHLDFALFFFFRSMSSPQVHTATVTTIQNCCQLSVSATLISAVYNFVSEQSNWWPHMYTEMANLSITTLLISATCYLSCWLKTPGYKPTSGSLGTFKPGDIVAVSVRSTAELRRLQDGHGGWNMQMSGVGLTR